jgi:hypothetical protein
MSPKIALDIFSPLHGAVRRLASSDGTPILPAFFLPLAFSP